ncbi:hypothetical protein [Streptomyces pseudovenezuelae]|uniref:hypothetical protein n=1 Tax=Streptomyces pseudovenezuelae TaxID=67350 RepID=UPI0036E4FAD7
MTTDIGRTLNALDARLKKVERSARLSHAAIDNTAVVVRDGAGGLKGIIGVQADGTTAVNIVNGSAPPQPSAPIVASVLGGVTVSWDGAFADGSALPLDWARVEVHASITAVYEPMPATLQGTIETAQGATVVVPCDTPVYVRLVARNTSGTASTASTIIGPTGPTPVVADDIIDGIVTTLKLADDAVTQAKIAAGAVGSTEIGAGAVLAANLANAAVEVGKIADNAVTGPAIASAAVTAGKLAANSVVASNIQAGAVTSAAVAAGAITTDKLTVTGGANVLSDPSFEGAYTASIVSGLSFASQDATMGNGSPKCLKIDCVNATAVTRQVVITTLPVLAGDQLYIGADYWVSTDWNGTEVDFQIRWEDSTGALVSFSKATTSSPVRTTWTRFTNTVTVPANAVTARVRAESVGATLGIVRFDNAVVRPVLAGTQIQDGVITTQKIAALTILAGNIAADAIAAGKIAADAVTAREIAALAVTAAEIAANTITAGKLAVGSVDATALAADAITGKTITGGTVTGALIQTAATGDRITLNESSANKVLVYDGSIVSAIAELSKRGLLVQGTNGSVLWLDPNATYPNLRLTNAAQTNSAVINVSETVTGAADLGLNSGTFSGSGFTDMKWRVFMGGDFWVAERIRNSASTTNIGGRLFLANDHATVAYQDTTTPANNHSLLVYSGYAQFNGGRVEVLPPASANPALKVNPASGHTGNLAQLQVAGTDKLTVDKDGNVTATGTITAASSSTTSGLIAASGFTTTTFYAYRFGKVVAIDLYMHRSGTTITATSGNIGDTQIATLPAGWRPTHTTINGAWDDGTSQGGWVVGTDGICTLRTASSDIVGDATSAGNGRNIRLHITFIQD